MLTGFVALVVAPFLIAATRHQYWERQHLMAPLVTLVVFAVLAALVVGRYRWAWMIFVVFDLVLIAGWVFDSSRFSALHLAGLAGDLTALVLLASGHMRTRLRRPVVIRVHPERA